MVRCWFIVCSIAVVHLSTVTSLALYKSPDDVTGPRVAAFDAGTSISSFKTQDEKHDVSGKRTATSDPSNRRIRRDLAAMSEHLETVRNVDDTSRRNIANEEAKKISVRLPPNVDRYNMFPFDYDEYNYRRGENDELTLAVKRLESLVAANELRRVAASRTAKGEPWSATSDANRRHHYDVNSRTEYAASDPGSEFDYLSGAVVDRDVGERESTDNGWEGRHQRSFDSLGGGLIPIKKQFDTLGGGIIPIVRKSSRGSEYSERSTEAEDRWLKSTKKQFDTLGGGLLPIKRRSQQSKLAAKNFDEVERSPKESSSDVRQRRNFDTLGGGLLPI